MNMACILLAGVYSLHSCPFVIGFVMADLASVLGEMHSVD